MFSLDPLCGISVLLNMHSYTTPNLIPSLNSFSGLGMRLRIGLDLASKLGLGYQWVWVETQSLRQSHCCSSSPTSKETNWSFHTSKPARAYQVQTAVSEPEPPGTGFCSPVVSAWSCTVGSCLGREEHNDYTTYHLLSLQYK